MKLSIVGSVRINEAEAYEIIKHVVHKYKPDCLVSGGAPGVDTLVEDAAVEAGIPCVVCVPAGRKWAFFKPRNLLIAEIGDRLVRIVSKDSATYGSGWTRDRAAEMGKPTEEYVVG